MKIMLVDDNRTYLALQRKVIENVGENEISCFESPIDALAAARDVEFDLVIVDYLMPGMDGIDFVGELRAATTTRSSRSSWSPPPTTSTRSTVP